ncbi:caspase family protein [Runella sp.]|uniref:caspase family protein n=1 Tax=Runella sp. TaxID=1960881 RepID=UPI003015EFB2
MKRSTFLSSLLLMLGFAPKIQSQAVINSDKPILHIFLAIDMSQPDRIPDRTKDRQAIESFFRSVAAQADMIPQVHYFSGSTLKSNIILAEIRKLGSFKGKKNGFVFYFSGHGGNWRDDKFPHLQLTNGHFPLTAINRLVVDTLKPKASIVIGDCCNNFVSDDLPLPNPLPPVNTDLIKKIFWDFGRPSIRINILLTAASQGQYSHSLIRQGSIFRQCFIEAFYNNTSVASDSGRDTDAIWTNIKNEASNCTVKIIDNLARRQKVSKQVPSGNITYTSNPDEIDR